MSKLLVLVALVAMGFFFFVGGGNLPSASIFTWGWDPKTMSAAPALLFWIPTLWWGVWLPLQMRGYLGQARFEHGRDKLPPLLAAMLVGAYLLFALGWLTSRDWVDFRSIWAEFGQKDIVDAAVRSKEKMTISELVTQLGSWATVPGWFLKYPLGGLVALWAIFNAPKWLYAAADKAVASMKPRPRKYRKAWLPARPSRAARAARAVASAKDKFFRVGISLLSAWRVYAPKLNDLLKAVAETLLTTVQRMLRRQQPQATSAGWRCFKRRPHPQMRAQSNPRARRRFRL